MTLPPTSCPPLRPLNSTRWRVFALFFMGNFSWIACADSPCPGPPRPMQRSEIRYPPRSQTNVTPMECWTPRLRKDRQPGARDTLEIPPFLCSLPLRLQYRCYRTSRGTELFHMQLNLNRKYLSTAAPQQGVLDFGTFLCFPVMALVSFLGLVTRTHSI